MLYLNTIHITIVWVLDLHGLIVASDLKLLRLITILSLLNFELISS